MSPHFLAQSGELLFGKAWAAQLAVALDCSTTSIGNYRSGKAAIPERIARKLRLMLTDRVAALSLLCKEIDTQTATP